MIGQCKLCSQTKKLQKSHYLPQGIYKRLRDENCENPNPWEISKGTAVQTSKQQCEFLLCSECERLFSENGENWVLRNCLQLNTKFPIASILASKAPDVRTGLTKVYYAKNIPQINVSALAYFAVSIFWRGSIHNWNCDGSIPIKFGPFQEQFRQYLLHLNTFPLNCSLWVVVREGKETDCVTFTPVTERQGNWHVHKFTMPGLIFMLLVGKMIPDNVRKMCIIHGDKNPIFVTSIIEPLIVQEAAKMINALPPDKRP